jgi:hypothetical protein
MKVEGKGMGVYWVNGNWTVHYEMFWGMSKVYHFFD